MTALLELNDPFANILGSGRGSGRVEPEELEVEELPRASPQLTLLALARAGVTQSCLYPYNRLLDELVEWGAGQAARQRGALRALCDELQGSALAQEIDSQWHERGGGMLRRILLRRIEQGGPDSYHYVDMTANMCYAQTAYDLAAEVLAEQGEQSRPGPARRRVQRGTSRAGPFPR